MSLSNEGKSCDTIWDYSHLVTADALNDVMESVYKADVFKTLANGNIRANELVNGYVSDYIQKNEMTWKDGVTYPVAHIIDLYYHKDSDTHINNKHWNELKNIPHVPEKIINTIIYLKLAKALWLEHGLNSHHDKLLDTIELHQESAILYQQLFEQATKVTQTSIEDIHIFAPALW